LTTRIWGVAGVTHHLLKTAAKQLRTWSRVIKKKAEVPLRRPKEISSELRVSTA
jgi:hypothetical protein